MRIPLDWPILSRDGTLAKGSKLQNAYMDGVITRSRPGIVSVDASLSGAPFGIIGAPIYSALTSDYSSRNYSRVAYTIINGTLYKIQSVPSFTFSTAKVIPWPSTWRTGQLVVLNGELYALPAGGTGAENGYVYKKSSLTGDWSVVTTSAGFSVVSGSMATVWGGLIWASNGWDNAVWYSANGVTWTQVVPEGNGGPGTFLFQGAPAGFSAAGSLQYLVNTDRSGGNTAMCYSATPTVASSWVSATDAPSDPGLGIGAVEAAGVAWNSITHIAGGRITGAYQDNVYSTSDGITTTLLTAAPGFAVRGDAKMLNVNGQHLVIGGWSSGGGGYGDVWRSMDGITWTQTASGLTAGTGIGGAGAVFDGYVLTSFYDDTAGGKIYYDEVAGNGEVGLTSIGAVSL